MPHLRWVQKVPRTANRSPPVKKTYAKGRLLPRGMWQMAGSPCWAQMAYPGGVGSGSWKQSSGNYSWPTSPSHTDNPTPFWAVHLEAGGPRCVVWFLWERATWCELLRYCFKGGVIVTVLQIVRSPIFLPSCDAVFQMVTSEPSLTGTRKPTTATPQQKPSCVWLAGGAARKWSDPITFNLR